MTATATFTNQQCFVITLSRQHWISLSVTPDGFAVALSLLPATNISKKLAHVLVRSGLRKYKYPGGSAWHRLHLYENRPSAATRTYINIEFLLATSGCFFFYLNECRNNIVQIGLRIFACTIQVIVCCKMDRYPK